MESSYYITHGRLLLSKNPFELVIGYFLYFCTPRCNATVLLFIIGKVTTEYKRTDHLQKKLYIYIRATHKKNRKISLCNSRYNETKCVEGLQIDYNNFHCLEKGHSYAAYLGIFENEENEVDQNFKIYQKKDREINKFGLNVTI